MHTARPNYLEARTGITRCVPLSLPQPPHEWPPIVEGAVDPIRMGSVQ